MTLGEKERDVAGLCDDEGTKHGSLDFNSRDRAGEINEKETVIVIVSDSCRKNE